ncbi:cytoskeleton-associated protein 4 [Osmerus eperlanus]|uniref:cytoskeleton-associated protein 4 n=1 Tax=Osmerus eperlanus TaxID=29151 RepID=UPI002E123115
MTKNRKPNTSEKNSAPYIQDDVAKKIQKTSNGVSGSAPHGSGSESWVKVIAVVCYIVLVAAAGFAAFYLQQVLEEVHEVSTKNEESLKENAELTRKMENVLQQVESLRSSVDGLESVLGTTRTELEGASRAVRKGEAETRRVEDALGRLQSELLRDLSDGIKEVKEAREQDFSSLEKTLEERLVELSRSIAASVAEFTEAQGEAQSQLADIKARLGDMEDPNLIKQELSAIVDTVAELGTNQKAVEASAISLGEQITAVGAELHTRNQEVGSLSQEVEAVRVLVLETSGSLKESLMGAEAGVQALTDQAQILQGGLELATGALHSLEKELQAEVSRAEKTSDDLDGRLRASEDTVESLVASVSDLSSQGESLLAKVDYHDSKQAAQSQAMEKALEGELDALRKSLVELQSNMAALSGSQTELAAKDYDVVEQIEGLKSVLAAQPPQDLENLRSTVDGLVEKAARLEKHDNAISVLQGELQKTISTLEALSNVPKHKEVKVGASS